jgi:hypothetical protein
MYACNVSVGENRNGSWFKPLTTDEIKSPMTCKVAALTLMLTSYSTIEEGKGEEESVNKKRDKDKSKTFFYLPVRLCPMAYLLMSNGAMVV